MAVAEETDRELSLVQPSQSRHLSTRDEPLPRCVSLWDPSSECFTLDDVAEGLEREKLSEGFVATLHLALREGGRQWRPLRCNCSH